MNQKKLILNEKVKVGAHFLIDTFSVTLSSIWFPRKRKKLDGETGISYERFVLSFGFDR